MTTPAIGGKVLDASALAALARGRLSALTWLAVAETHGIVLLLPTLALTEVRALLPDTGPLLAELLEHPCVVLAELDASTGRAVETILEAAGTFDVLAGQVVHLAQQRGWPALTDAPDRLRRLAPDLEIDLL